MNWQSLITVLPTAVSAAFFATTHLTFAAAMARKSDSTMPSPAPRVSVLKPVAGRDEELLQNLASFVDLDYPDHELLLGTASLEDPAVPVIQAFIAANPRLSARLVITSPPRGEIKNPKVAQLIDLARAATGSVLVVSDANIRVPSSYLRNLVSALSRPGVGLVSSVVVGAGERTLAAAIDSAQLGAYVAPSVAAAHALNLWPITVGKSMAMRRRDLAAVGGFEGVAGVLAEDDVLGQRFHAHGLGVDLCFDPVENHGAHLTWSAMLDRHARWAMIRRSLTPLGFTFELLLSPLLVAAGIAAVAPSRAAFAALAFSLVLMWAGALLSLTRAHNPHAFALAALEPLRVATMSLCWVLGAVRRKVVWRGNAFSLTAGSRLLPVSPDARLAHGGRSHG
jgi:ceramide glucosyltransferase